MEKIHVELFDSLEIGDDHPTIIMGVLNLSPESFYKGSVYERLDDIENATLRMINNRAKIIDIGARSTAPWSKKISVDDELNRFAPSMEKICEIIPKDVIISVDTQYQKVAEKALEISIQFGKKIIINDVSCLKTDPKLQEFIIKNNLPIILMASKKIPGDLLAIEEIINEFKQAIKLLKSKGYNENKVIIDPGIGHWVEEKTHIYDLRIIHNLSKLKTLKKPILVAISRKSFIGTTLNLPDPADRLNGTLSATAIAVFNGAHIVRTHDVSQQLLEIIKMAEEIRKNE
ncbi:MAG: dihydropteroate synthase [Candidatus Heimdallarchaeota archaeon]